MGDLFTSLVRTWVPIVVGYLIGLGLLPADLSTEAALTFTALIMGVYYLLARWLERKWPFLGWLLGLPRTPTY